ncbi:MAG: 4'-phosphopantetheinyl transferase superfamily protein [Prevotellaceae bacterium]|jgi:4'-phosphopantetheinyl transferase EntD|nr:4'-phosphopantetheinyl transferase superfamily protein [Prevotellaceae bacterium]
MPLLLEHSGPGCRWGIWKTDETDAELLALLPHGEAYRAEAARFSSAHRRTEWLAVRVLLFHLLGSEHRIAYHLNGRPYLADASRAISISHTRGYVAVIVGSPYGEVSIDIEQYGEKVHRVARRFIRDDESVATYQNTDTWSLLLHWSAKEVMYKSLDAQDVDFVRHLRILPFTPAESGTFVALEQRTPQRRRFRIHYRIFPAFVLTWHVRGDI